MALADGPEIETLPELRIAIDTGGTFTDCVYVRNAQIEILKVPSTPRNPAEAIERALKEIVSRLAPQSIAPLDLVCGTTVGTNALLQRRGGRVVLVTTAGFEDVLEIGRQARPKLYDFFGGRPTPLVPNERRLGLRERIGSEGEILTEPTPQNIRAIIRQVQIAKPDAVAICFLFSFVNPKHEKQIAKALRAAGQVVTASHEVFPEIREFERTSTTVVNAYLIPVMSGYLAAIDKIAKRVVANASAPNTDRKQRPPQSQVRLMQSNGGIVSASSAASEPVRTILSGPAGGILGAEYIASLAGYEKVISFDMGGTSTDVALLDGPARTTNESVVDDLPVSVPMLDIHTVGAGGGSIARIDQGGALRVGPESAGADPGPAAYGKGNQPTVTDAHLILGRLGGATLLGGEFQLDADKARQAVNRARKKSTSLSTPEQFAQGTIDVVEATMARAIRVNSVERGHDPRDYSLVAFGGAGGLHACALAAALEIPRVIIPKIPGALSVLGILRADTVKDFSQTVLFRPEASEKTNSRLENLFRDLESRARTQMGAESQVAPASLPASDEDNSTQIQQSPTAHKSALVAARLQAGIQRRKSTQQEVSPTDHPQNQIRALRFLDVRYSGQSTTLKIPATKNFRNTFHKEHEKRYGYADPTREIEIVNIAIRLIAQTPKPKLPRKQSQGSNASPAIQSKAPVYFEGKWTPTPLYVRNRLKAGNQFVGPAIITDYSSTTVLPPGWRANVDAHENLILTPRKV